MNTIVAVDIRRCLGNWGTVMFWAREAPARPSLQTLKIAAPWTAVINPANRGPGPVERPGERIYNGQQ